jgi:tRNA threonylcarbamoyl adenosine modification protein YeaZ
MILVWSQKNNKLLGKSIFSTEKNSSEVIISKIEVLLNKYCIGYSQIEKIVAVIGPGNYTNIRVGISAAKGIGLVLNIPIFGMTQHELVAKTYKKHLSSILCVLVHAKNEDFYFQKFNNGISLDEIKVVSFHDILNEIIKKKFCIIETGKDFLSLLLKKNKNLENLVSNHIICSNSIGLIFRDLDKNTNKNLPKYIKGPNAEKYKKENIYL